MVSRINEYGGSGGMGSGGMFARRAKVAKTSAKATENVHKTAAAARAAKSAEAVAAREATSAKLKSDAIARRIEDRANANAARTGRTRTGPKPKDLTAKLRLDEYDRKLRQDKYQRESRQITDALSAPKTATAPRKVKPGESPQFLGKLPERTRGAGGWRVSLKGVVIGTGHITRKIKPKLNVHHAAIPPSNIPIPSTHVPRPPKPKKPDEGAAPSKALRTPEIILKPGQNKGKPSRVVSQVQAHKVAESALGKNPYGRKPDASKMEVTPPKVEATEVTVKSTNKKLLTKEQLVKKAAGIAKTKTKAIFKGPRKKGQTK